MKAEINIEELISRDIASKILETIPDEQRQQLLEKSLTKTLENILSPWNVERTIKADVEEYMVEYVKKPKVQERVRIATHKSVDVLLDSVIKAIVIGAQDRLQNTYAKLIKEKGSD